MEEKSESLADKTLDKKATQKPDTKLEAASLLGKIFTLMKKKREQDLKYRTEEKRNQSQQQLEETQKQIKILESVEESKGKGKKSKKEKPIKDKKENKKGKSLFSFYPDGLLGVLTDATIVGGLLFTLSKDSSDIEKDFGDLVQDDILEKLKDFDYNPEEQKSAKEEKPPAAPVTPPAEPAPTQTKPNVPDVPAPQPPAPSTESATKVSKNPEPVAPPTATKIPQGNKKYGYLSEEALSAVISTHEGNATSVYGDYKDKGQMRNKFGQRPEEWSKENLGVEKKLTDFTFSELLQYQKYRLKASGKSTGAVGIAGFMPTTIFGKQLDGKIGLFAQSGLSWNDKFSESNQKVLQSAMNDEQDKVLKAGLKKLGIDSISPGIKLAANYVGATGVLWVIEEGQNDPNITVAQALQKRDPKHRDPTEGNTINKDLAITKAKDFIASKDKYVYDTAVKKGLVTPMPNMNTTGTAVANKSSENANAKADAKTAQSNVTNNISIQSQQNSKSQSTDGKKEDDRPAYQKKVTQ
jgi:hypothetical protein